MNQRTSLCGLTLGTLAAPRGVETQHTEKRPRIGYLQGPQNENVVAFIQGLHDAGHPVSQA